MEICNSVYNEHLKWKHQQQKKGTVVTEYLNNKYLDVLINVNDNHQLCLIIKSGTGTGKTLFLENKIINKYDSVIYISTRKTFTHNIKARFNGLLISYEDITEDYNIPQEKYPKIILQIESINRISDWNLNNTVLILDEYESIITQLYDKHELQQIFINELIRKCYYMIILDATLDIFRSLSILPISINKRIIINEYKMYSGNTINVKMLNNKNHKQELITDIINGINNNKRIVCCISSIKLARMVYDSLPLNTSVIFMHGDNYLLNGNEFHFEYKQKTIPIINEQILEHNVQLLLYTGTITNGVDINIQNHFDTFIHAYNQKCTTSNLFFQSMF